MKTRKQFYRSCTRHTTKRFSRKWFSTALNTNVINKSRSTANKLLSRKYTSLLLSTETIQHHRARPSLRPRSIIEIKREDELHCNKNSWKKRRRILQFQNLPVICQIHVFTFLNDFEKCQASMVCLTWARLIRSPSLWTKADFTQIGLLRVNFRHLCSQTMLDFQFTSEDSINNHLEEMSERYIKSLINRKAALHVLKFKFDIIEKEESWLKLLEICLTKTVSKGLRMLECDWSQTVFCKAYCRAMTWYHLKPRKHLKRERIACFQRFLKVLHSTSPNILTISCPFDWSPSSVGHIVRFECLKELKLARYWALRGMQQEELTTLLQTLLHLERLTIEVWIPIQHNQHHFKIVSKSLKYLDIRKCNGFYLSDLDLPNLEVLREVKCYVGPLIMSESLKVRCLLDVLRAGAPKLNTLNDLKLLPIWKS
ncbi:uncharacterized protein LOC117121236, partial [Anneissia japonica]|uniref:uncharacterized protein LOC117121236 n=1 Tax=Anneissia japonica TaxID=1529436 RepID=UPI001425838C